jgi:anaerobic magnesium-protoporphyrin IX monomethyl ester cyclase
MRVLLLYPNLYGMNMLPPAIGLFTAILKREGHVVALFDTTIYEGLTSVDSDKMKSDNLNARPFDDSLLKQSTRKTDAVEDFRALVSDFSPDLIAMSVTEDMYPIGIALLSALGDDRPKVVAGGVFPTFAPDLTLRYSNGCIDFVLKGEGDETLADLCRRMESGSELTSLPGLHALIDGRQIDNLLPRPVDLTTQPEPDYDQFEESRFYRPMQGRLWRMFPVQTIRGCPYTCAYCNSPSQTDIHDDANYKFFRKQRMDLVRRELLVCRDRYKADSFYFWADTFLAWSDKEFDEFCEMYAEFRLPFWIQTRPETVKKERFRKLKEIGLLRVAFGVEHGNDAFRQRVLSRKVKNEKIIENLKIVTDLGIPISVNNIMGFPTETRELVFDTIELNRHFKSDGINAYTFTPFHGTPLRKLSEDLGYVEHGTLARSITAPTMLSMPEFPKEEIEGLRRCFVLYVKMPKDRWPEIRHAEALTPEGDRVFRELKDECLVKYMNYGDYAKEDDIEKVEFAKDDPEKIVGFRKGDVSKVDFDAILRRHAIAGTAAERTVIRIEK